MIYHLNRLMEAYTGASILQSEVLIPDVFILLLCHVANHTSSSTVWMDTGLSNNNTRIYINISQLVGHLDRNTINTLTALHAFTGSDFTAAFMVKGKLQALQLIMKSHNNAFRDAFYNLGHCDLSAPADFADIEKLYGLPKLSKSMMLGLLCFNRSMHPKSLVIQ